MAAPQTPPALDHGPSRPTRILVADDDHVNRLILSAILAKDGHEIAVAEDGQKAVDKYISWSPDLVLMDIMMPVMDGYEATRRIKQLAGDRYVPVFFLTALTDEAALARCVSYGGDDFLTKPYSRVILKAKIDALERTRRMHAVLHEQRDQLAAYQRRQQYEFTVAEKVLARIVHTGCLDAEQIRYMLSPVAIFNGDLLLAARKPSGGLHLLLGDFTGHGLSAAVGTIPVADIFYGMTERGFLHGDILAQINNKLRVILPPDVFFAALMIDLDGEHGRMTVWNGGCPDLIVRRNSGEVVSLPSMHLPLGVIEENAFDPAAQVIEVVSGDRILALSDGVIEARSPDGEMFGLERLIETLGRLPAESTPFEAIVDRLGDFLEGSPLGDDLTLVEVLVDPTWSLAPGGEVPVPLHTRAPSRWSITLELLPEMMRSLDPVPLFMQMLLDVQGLYEYREQLFVVLSELYSNALEHGLLGMDSSLKNSPEGFAGYYALRRQRLADLDHGAIRIDLEHTPDNGGGRIRLRVADDGAGFDPERVISELQDNAEVYGRGVSLVRSLCDEVTYSRTGNEVEAIYSWSPVDK